MPAARILVVDDDPEAGAMIRRWFADQPCEVLTAEDGDAGLSVALQQHPDLILLDLNMPGLNGIEVARRLRTEPATRNVPLILVTANRNLEKKVEAFSVGADDYVTKPFELEEIEARIRGMLERGRRLAGLEGLVRNLESSKGELEQLLMVDEKTGLYNFREFQRRLHDEWSRAERYNVSLSLIFLDLDWFKKVNDTLGHQAGDRVLQEFALLVTGGARTTDFAARYGGEEFAVILPHTDREMALLVANRIRRAVEEFVFVADQTPTRITVSAGVATYPSRPEINSVDALVRAADMALYRAKDQGRNRVVPDSLSPESKTR